MKKMSDREIVAVKSIVRGVVGLIIDIGIAIRDPSAENGSDAMADAMASADDLVEGINAVAGDLWDD